MCTYRNYQPENHLPLNLYTQLHTTIFLLIRNQAETSRLTYRTQTTYRTIIEEYAATIIGVLYDLVVSTYRTSLSA